MPDSFELSRLNPFSFEHLVNQIAMQVLGSGHTGFNPGADGGRDGYFEGEAPYPSEKTRWSGTWYIQSKFLAPSLSNDPQRWIFEQVVKEIKAFQDPSKGRIVPDCWIIATNVDLTAVPKKGSFDKIRSAVTKAFPRLKNRFDIWGGTKILDFLGRYPNISRYYRHFLTPGHVLTELYESFKDDRIELDAVLNYLIGRQFSEQQFTKLEQAGSDADTRPGIHRLFIDVPFEVNSHHVSSYVLRTLVKASLKCQTPESRKLENPQWRFWNNHPDRSRVWFIKGGPGQGKSTVGQYFCQIQRASHILNAPDFPVAGTVLETARDIKIAAEKDGYWTANPRIPVVVELKDFAKWFSERKDKRDESPRGVLTYLASKITQGVEQTVKVGTLKRLLSEQTWFFSFDGLDEVPHDVKDLIADEIRHFIDRVLLERNCDALCICTSRPQGYSGQFDDLDGPILHLAKLSPDEALRCARPVLRLGRTESETQKSYEILQSAISSVSVRELMTTPLQAHIMAVVVRDGGRPPERRWELFRKFYEVIKRREANRDLPDPLLAKLLRADDQLLKTVHSRLGFVLHSRAETSQGAVTTLDRTEFYEIVDQAVAQLVETNVEQKVATVMEATAERLVLVNTPDDGDSVRFDVRQLQEFFAAEFIFETSGTSSLRQRMETILGDSHWAEVSHFLLSALIANNRRTELAIAVEILARLDDPTEEDAGFLRYRMARGASLVAKLLQEGVLEQDKRIRNLFRERLGPLLGLRKSSGLNTLSSTQEGDTFSWLIDVLMNSLHSSSYSENIGATAILTNLLPDGHPLVSDVMEFVRRSSPEYKSLVLMSAIESMDIFARLRSAMREKRKIWLIAMVVEAFLSDDWHLLKPEILTRLSSITLRDRAVLNDVGEFLQLGESELALLTFLFSSMERSNNVKAVTSEDYGIVTIRRVKKGAVRTEAMAPFRHLVKDVPPVEGRGILSFVQRSLFAAFDGGKSSLDRFLTDFPQAANFYHYLHHDVRANLPFSYDYSISDQASFLQSISDEQLAKLENFSPYVLNNRIVDVEFDGGECTSEQWSRLVERVPEIALLLWDGRGMWPTYKAKKSPLDKESTWPILHDALIRRPDILYNQPSSWAKVFARDETGHLRAKMNEFALENDHFWNDAYRDDSLEFPQLSLPTEAPLLVPLASLLSQPVLGPAEDAWKPKGKKVASVESLKAVLKDSTFASPTRAAALIFLMEQSPCSSMIKDHADDVIEIAMTSIKETWFFRSLGQLFMQDGINETESLKLLLSELLRLTRDDLMAREAFYNVLNAQKEKSVAPVTSRGVIEKWLQDEEG